MADLVAMIAPGNHKSSTKIPSEALIKRYQKELDRGWLIPLPVDFLLELKHARAIPMGLAFQKTVNEQEDIIDKERLTHDMSFPAPSGSSVNKHTGQELLQPCVYGQCLRRFIHMILVLRHSHPTSPVIISKYDLDAAYWRLHSNPLHALKVITIIKKLVYILTRLPFGACTGPSVYSSVSETIFNLANNIINETEWDPTTLRSPHSSKLSEPSLNPIPDPFEAAQELLMDLPLKEIFFDGYINDVIAIALARRGNARRSQDAVPLAVHAVYRPLSTSEPVTRDDPLSLRKLSGEGTPNEQKIVLGWLLCTRTLRIYLPHEKSIFWCKEIDSLLATTTRIRGKTLECMVGKFNRLRVIF